MTKRMFLVTGMAGLFLFAGAVVIGSALSAGEQDKKKTGKETKAVSPATYKVAKKTFRVELEVKGTLEAEKTAEIVYRPQPAGSVPSTGSLIVQKVVSHGAKVAKDDVLLVLDTRRIDQVIDQMEPDKKVLDAKIKLVEEEISYLKQAMPVEISGGEQAAKQAEEDLKYFFKVARAEMEKKAHYYVKNAAFWLESEKEDLRQLEKMYKSKDLTEETEKIILKRQKFWVEMAEYSFKQAEIERDYVLKVTLPRKEKALTDNVAKTALALDKARQIPTQIFEKEQALVKLRHDRDTIIRQLDNLQKDRQAMTFKAPMTGTVYYGKFSRGKWTTAADMAAKLVPNGTISADQVLMTILNPSPKLVRLLVEEKDVHLLKPDLKGKAKVPFRPDLKLPAKVVEVSPVPSEPGKFETLVAVDLGQDAASLMPGMACSVKFVPYSKKDALVIPKKAIFEEEDCSYVWVMADGKKVQREVQPGKTSGDNVEILNGLSEGEAIVADATDGKKADTTDSKKTETPAKKGTTP